MTYPILPVEEQKKVYLEAYREGMLVRKGWLRLSNYTLNAIGDFPVGSWSQCHCHGYYDGYNGLNSYWN